MSKAAHVLEFYETTQKLKTVIRSGWKIWGVTAERVESIAEHVYGVQMLAVAVYSEYDYDIDLPKTIMMLAVHELEEIYIGDITPFDGITKEEKRRLGHEAVAKILSPLAKKSEIMSLVLEYDDNKTPEAHFAHCCDKLEAGLQAHLYDSAHAFADPSTIADNPAVSDPEVSALIKKHGDLSSAWLEYWESRDVYDDNFLAISVAARSKA